MLVTSQNVHEFLQNYTSEDAHYYKHIKEVQPVGCTHTISSEYEGMANILKVQIVREQYVKENYGIKIIGSVGPAMKESIDLVKSVVGNFIVNKLGTTNIFEKPLVLSFSFPGDKKNSASMGAAIFASFVSLITNTPVHQGMSIVGEVDLNGNILKIGMAVI
jgi:ATP-dependent Lon protease